MEAVIRPQFDGSVEVVGEMLRITCDGSTVATEKTEIGFTFLAEGRKAYILASGV